MDKEGISMKTKPIAKLMVLAAGMLLASCGGGTSSASSAVSSAVSSSATATSSAVTSEGTSSKTSSSSSSKESSASSSSSSSSSAATSSASTSKESQTFTITTEDGAFTRTDSSIVITSAGTYELSGDFEGQISGDLGDDDVVELDLCGVNLSNGNDSVIKFGNADKLKISAKNGYDNYITDTRAEATTEDSTQGDAAIYAECDLNLIGKGSLTVVGTYNNGIHTKDDLTIKNETLTVTAPNNAIKGNDSVTIESGTLSVTSTYGDGIKTTNSDISSSGNQRGTVSIAGGTVDISSCYDAVDAAYDIYVTEDDSTVPTELTIKTNSYRTSTSTKAATRDFGPGGNGSGDQGGPGGSGGTFPGEDSSESAEASAKGLKADNQIMITGGTLDISAYDDAIHANDDETLENGDSPLGDVTVTGGDITLVASDDGIHADGTLSVSGGSILVEESYEGIEGDTMVFSGGESIVYASNDAINAGSALTVGGGYVFGAVNSSGDCDGIDSNGTLTVTGGVLIGCGPYSEMASPFDCDCTISVKGGTLMAFGYRPTISSSLTSSSKNGTFGTGEYTAKFANGSVEVANLPYSYTNCYAWSALGSLSSIS